MLRTATEDLVQMVRFKSDFGHVSPGTLTHIQGAGEPASVTPG
jgi:hypothetical protein